MLQFLATMNPLYGVIAVGVLTLFGGLMYFKADKPLFSLPFFAAAAYIGFHLFQRLGN